MDDAIAGHERPFVFLVVTVAAKWSVPWHVTGMNKSRQLRLGTRPDCFPKVQAVHDARRRTLPASSLQASERSVQACWYQTHHCKEPTAAQPQAISESAL